MGLFDFGGSSSRTDARSQSQSSSFDNLDRLGINLGINRGFSQSSGQSSSASSSFGEQGSTARSRSGGSSRALSSQDVFLADTFRSLYGGAGAAAGAVNADTLANTASLLFNRGGSFLDTLQGGGRGQQFINERLANNDLAEQRVGQLRSDIQEFLAEGADRQITSSGVAAGTLGGARSRVQRNEALQQGAQAFARGALDIRQGDQDARDRLAGTLLQSDVARSTAGLSALPGVLGLQESSELAGLTPFAALSSIIGGPTALTTSASVGDQFGVSASDSFGRSGSQAISQSLQQALSEQFGFDFGFDQTTGRAGSQSTSSSTQTSRSKSFNFGFGSL